MEDRVEGAELAIRSRRLGRPRDCEREVEGWEVVSEETVALCWLVVIQLDTLSLVVDIASSSRSSVSSLLIVVCEEVERAREPDERTDPVGVRLS